MEDRRDKDVRDAEKRDVEARSEVEDVGRKGGAAAMAAGAPYTAERADVALLTRDLVRWGPIWAGLLIALSIQVVLGSIGLGVALRSHNPAAADYAAAVGTTLSWWSAISMLVALFVGGYVAGRMAAVLGLRNGMTQGTVVWALALLIGVILSAMGVAGIIGNTAGSLPALLGRGVDVSGPAARRLIESAVSSTWWFVGASILAWVAAAVGGILGSAAHVSDVVDTAHAPHTAG